MSDSSTVAANVISEMLVSAVSSATRFGSEAISAVSCSASVLTVDAVAESAWEVHIRDGAGAGKGGGLQASSNDEAMAKARECANEVRARLPSRLMEWVTSAPGELWIMPRVAGVAPELAEWTFSSVCSGCNHGKVPCQACTEKGAIQCADCSGRGECQCQCRIGYVTCPGCGGSGSQACTTCSGRGTQFCHSCGGRGFRTINKTVYYVEDHGKGPFQASRIVPEDVPCQSCRGGRIDCYTCGARGHVRCSGCGGEKTLTCGVCHGRAIVGCATCGSSGEVVCLSCQGGRKVDHADCAGTGWHHTFSEAISETRNSQKIFFPEAFQEELRLAIEGAWRENLVSMFDVRHVESNAVGPKILRRWTLSIERWTFSCKVNGHDFSADFYGRNYTPLPGGNPVAKVVALAESADKEALAKAISGDGCVEEALVNSLRSPAARKRAEKDLASASPTGNEAKAVLMLAAAGKINWLIVAVALPFVVRFAAYPFHFTTWQGWLAGTAAAAIASYGLLVMWQSVVAGRARRIVRRVDTAEAADSPIISAAQRNPAATMPSILLAGAVAMSSVWQWGDIGHAANEKAIAEAAAKAADDARVRERMKELAMQSRKQHRDEIAKGHNRAFVHALNVARSGVPWAQAIVGIALLEGKAVKRDPAAGEKWLRLAVQSGDAEAMVILGDLAASRGRFGEAAQLWGRAAKLDFDGARARLVHAARKGSREAAAELVALG